MGIVREDGDIQYTFTGPQGFDQFEALKTVLLQEKIPFVEETTPEVLSVVVTSEYGVRVREAVAKWTTSMHIVHHVVWYD